MESLDRRQFIGFIALLAAAFGVNLDTKKKTTIGSKLAKRIREEFTDLSWAEREKLFKEGIRVLNGRSGVTLVIFEGGPVPKNLFPEMQNDPVPDASFRRVKTKPHVINVPSEPKDGGAVVMSRDDLVQDFTNPPRAFATTKV